MLLIIKHFCLAVVESTLSEVRTAIQQHKTVKHI